VRPNQVQVGDLGQGGKTQANMTAEFVREELSALMWDEDLPRFML